MKLLNLLYQNMKRLISYHGKLEDIYRPFRLLKPLSSTVLTLPIRLELAFGLLITWEGLRLEGALTTFLSHLKPTVRMQLIYLEQS